MGLRLSTNEGAVGQFERRTRLTAGIFTCPHCGAVYEVTYTRMEARDDDRAICDKCHKVMKEWNDTFSRSFKLKVG